MVSLAVAALGILGSLTAAQQAGTTGDNIEKPPPLALSLCTKATGCKIQQANVTLDANWRWVYKVMCPGSGQPCYSAGNCFNAGQWDKSVCSDPEACAKKCAVAGVNAQKYQDTYGVIPTPGGVELKFVTGTNIGSRLYLTIGENYKIFRLKNREFSFDVDASALPCGLNGAVYFVEMPEDGGKGGNNQAGAPYGTGYCDAQCPHDVKFMNGMANVLDWNQTNPFGRMGACCSEMDIWEANSAAAALTPHPCHMNGPLMCGGRSCGDTAKGERYKGVCDKDGCDFNSYRMGSPNFLGAGPEFEVDTTKKITVVTQWLTTDGTDGGDLSEIRRIYVQDGKAIQNSMASVLPGSPGNSITDALCQAQKLEFGDPDDFTMKGGLRQMGKALERGMVLVMSLWDDDITSMLWLDSSTGTVGKKGAVRGPCPSSSGQPRDVRSKHAGASVKYSNFMYGEIGSTYNTLPEAKPETAAKVDPYAARLSDYAKARPPTSRPSPEQAPAADQQSTQQSWQPSMGLTPASVCAREFELCSGGQEWTGPRCCNDGCTCTPRFWSVSQCIPDAGQASCPAPAATAPPSQSVEPGDLQSSFGSLQRAQPANWGSSVGGVAFFVLVLLCASACIAGPYARQRYLGRSADVVAPGSPLSRIARRPSERELTSPRPGRSALDLAAMMGLTRAPSTVSMCRPDEV
uniref:cellulase n=1 Tax=Alexandrium monilatum TaxID=311494 RepID=A0A7S4RQ07_9DINO